MAGTHVRWAFRLAHWQAINKDQIRKAFARIQPEEVERLMKFVFLDDLKASLVGRLMIRNFVVGATGTDNASFRIDRDERGKPYLPGNRSLDFNVSHQGGFAVLAGWSATGDGQKSQDIPLRLGVDVMKMEYVGGKSVQEFFRLMERNFTSGEWRYIKSGTNPEDHIGRFMRVWCLKESYVKCIGVGITVDLRKIDFHISTPLAKGANTVNLTTRVQLNGQTEDNWHFEETRLDDEHCVAVAINSPGSNSSSALSIKEDGGFRFIDIEWLIENIDPLRREEDIDEDLCSQVLRKDVK